MRPGGRAPVCVPGRRAELQPSTGDRVRLHRAPSGPRVPERPLASLSVDHQRSAEIEQVSLPQLEQQTVSAQGAGIQGFSGATYTTQAYESSLQAALDKF